MDSIHKKFSEYKNRPLFKKIKEYIHTHKIISSIVGLVILVSGYYWIKSLTSTTGENRYVLANVERGTIVTSITGSGQISSENQVDIKAKASGDVVYIPVLNGQYVKAGQIIAELDTTDAEKAVRDAEVNLESAQLALQKLQAPADNLTTIQTQDALSQAKSDLETAYENGFTNISNTFLDLPTVMTGMQDVLYGTEASRGGQDNISTYTDMVKNYDSTVTTFHDDVINKYLIARTAYDKNFTDWKASSRTDSQDKIDALIAETYATTKAVSDSVKSTNDLLNFVKDRLTLHNIQIPTTLNSAQSSLLTYTNETNSHLASLLDITNTIINSNLTIAEKNASLSKLQSGADPLDISSQKLNVTQRENALQDAKDNLANYYIRAPFDGTLAKLNVKHGDSAQSGTVVATIVTAQQLATVSLNEVDVAKIKIGEKVTLTFDAIDGLTMTGSVAQIDTVGTVTQGVVTYTVTINLDSQDDRIKSGMSVGAGIITDIKQNVLMVPNGAVKNQGGTSYVQIFTPPLVDSTNTGNAGIVSKLTPIQQSVITGASNDTDTEIISGLTEGQQIVTRTITGTTATTNTTPSLLNSLGGSRGGATGGVRVGGGATGR